MKNVRVVLLPCIYVVTFLHMAPVNALNLMSTMSTEISTCRPGLNLEVDETKKLEDQIKEAKEILKCTKNAQASTLAPLSINEQAAYRPVTQDTVDATAKQLAGKNAEATFLGLNFGIGFGFTHSEDDAIDEAVIVDGIVREVSNKRTQPRVFFEFHKYFYCNVNGTSGKKGCGPFMTIAATQDDVLSGVGLGWMWGWKTKTEDTDGFSIGLGAILDANVKDLADGFKVNQEAPNNETEVRYIEESRWSLMLIMTRTF